MNDNTIKVFLSWKKGKACKVTASVWTDGLTVYSYGKGILERRTEELSTLNGTRYSMTTSRQQNNLRKLLNDHCMRYVEYMIDNG